MITAKVKVKNSKVSEICQVPLVEIQRSVTITAQITAQFVFCNTNISLKIIDDIGFRGIGSCRFLKVIYSIH